LVQNKLVHRTTSLAIPLSSAIKKVTASASIKI